MHRRDHARRVPQVHREGRCAGASLPAGHGRGAHARARPSRSSTASATATKRHHRVKITDDAARAAVELSIRYITDRHLPDKAIDLIDEAASRVRLRHSSKPPELKATQKELERIAKEKEAAVNDQDYERAQELRDAESAAKARADQLRSDWQAARPPRRPR